VVAVAVKYFTLSARGTQKHDVRACYNIFNQYRLLAELLLRQAEPIWCERRASLCLLRPGRPRRRKKDGFRHRDFGHDLGALCEHAFELASSAHDTMLGIFLEVDREADSKADEKALRGVRKAQVKLGTYYLVHGAAGLRAAAFLTTCARRAPSVSPPSAPKCCAFTPRIFLGITDRGVTLTTSTIPAGRSLTTVLRRSKFEVD